MTRKNGDWISAPTKFAHSAFRYAKLDDWYCAAISFQERQNAAVITFMSFAY